MIASPEKALCDKIIVTSGVQLRSISQTMDFLLEDLRIDEEQLRQLDATSIQTWVIDSPKRNSLQMLVNTIQRL
jgi:hypothetical protein